MHRFQHLIRSIKDFEDPFLENQVNTFRDIWGKKHQANPYEMIPKSKRDPTYFDDRRLMRQEVSPVNGLGMLVKKGVVLCFDVV